MGKHSHKRKANKQKHSVNTTTDSYAQFEEGLLRNSTNINNPNEHRSTNNITKQNKSKFLNITINIKAPVQSEEEEELINSVVSKLNSFNSRNVSTISQGADYGTFMDNFVMPRPIKVENVDELGNDSFTNETYAERIRREYGINIEDRNRQLGIKEENDDFLSIISDIGSSTVNCSDQIVSCNRKRIKQLTFDKIEQIGEFSVRNKSLPSDNNEAVTENVIISPDNNEEDNEEKGLISVADSTNCSDKHLNDNKREENDDEHTTIVNDELNLKVDIDYSNEPKNIEISNCTVIDGNCTNTLNEDTAASKIETNQENLNNNSSMEEDFDIISSEIIENITVSHNITNSLKQTLLTSNLNMETINALKNNSGTSTDLETNERIINKSAAEKTSVSHESENRSKEVVLTSCDELLVKVSTKETSPKASTCKKKVKRKKQQNEMTESGEGATSENVETTTSTSYRKTLETNSDTNEQQSTHDLQDISQCNNEKRSVHTVKNENESASEGCSPERASKKNKETPPKVMKTEIIPHNESITHLENQSSKSLSINDKCDLNVDQKQGEAMSVNDSVGFTNSNDAMTTHEIIDLVVDMYQENHENNEEYSSKSEADNKFLHNETVKGKNHSGDENKHETNLEDTVLSNRESPKHFNNQSDDEQQREIDNRRLYAIEDTKIEHNDMLKTESDTDDSENCECYKEDNQESKLHYSSHQLEHDSTDDEDMVFTRKSKQSLHDVLSDNSSDSSGNDSSNKKENIIFKSNKNSVIEENDKNSNEIATQEIIGIVMEALGDTGEGSCKDHQSKLENHDARTKPTKTDDKATSIDQFFKNSPNLNKTSKNKSNHDVLTSKKNEKSEHVSSKPNIQDSADIEKLNEDILSDSSDSEEVMSSKLKNSRTKFNRINKKLQESRHSKHHKSDITTDTSSDRESSKNRKINTSSDGLSDTEENLQSTKVNCPNKLQSSMNSKCKKSDIRMSKEAKVHSKSDLKLKKNESKRCNLSDALSSTDEESVVSKTDLKEVTTLKFQKDKEVSRRSSDIKATKNIEKSKQAKSDILSDDTSPNSDTNISSKFGKTKKQSLQGSSNEDLVNVRVSKKQETVTSTVASSVNKSSEQKLTNSKKSPTLLDDTSSSSDQSVASKFQKIKNKLSTPNQKLTKTGNSKRSKRDTSSDSENDTKAILQNSRTKSNHSSCQKITQIKKTNQTKSDTLFDTSSDDEENDSWKYKENKSKSDREDSDEALRSWRKTLRKKKNDVPLNRAQEKNNENNTSEVNPQKKYQKKIKETSASKVKEMKNEKDQQNITIQEIHGDDTMSNQEVLDIVMNVYNTHYNIEEQKQCSEVSVNKEYEKDSIKSKRKALSLKKNQKITDIEKSSSDSENTTINTSQMLKKKKANVKHNIANDKDNQSNNGESSDSMKNIVSKQFLNVKFKNKTSTPSTDNIAELTKKNLNLHNESTKKNDKVIKETTLNEKQDVNKKSITAEDNQKTKDIPTQEILDIVMEAFGDTNKPADTNEDNPKSNSKLPKKALGKKTPLNKKAVNEHQKMNCDSNDKSRNFESKEDISSHIRSASSDIDKVKNIGKKSNCTNLHNSSKCDETSDTCSDQEVAKIKISKEHKTDILSDTSSDTEQDFEATKPDSSNKLQTSPLSKSKKSDDISDVTHQQALEKSGNKIPNMSSDNEELKSSKKATNNKTTTNSSRNTKNKKTTSEKRKGNNDSINTESQDASIVQKQQNESPRKVSSSCAQNQSDPIVNNQDSTRRRSPRKTVQNKESGNSSTLQTETSKNKSVSKAVEQNKVNTMNENVANVTDPVKKTSTNSEQESSIPLILKMVDLTPKIKDKSKTKEKLKVKFDFMKLRTRQSLNKSTDKNHSLITNYLQDNASLKAGEDNEKNDVTKQSTVPKKQAQCETEKHDIASSSGITRRSPRIKEKSKHHKDEGNNQSQKELSSEITSFDSEEVIRESQVSITSQDMLEQQNEVCLTNNPRKNNKGVNNEAVGQIDNSNVDHQPEADISATLLISHTNIEECMSSFDMETNILTESLLAECGTKMSDINSTLDSDKTGCTESVNQNNIKKCTSHTGSKSNVLSESLLEQSETRTSNLGSSPNPNRMPDIQSAAHSQGTCDEEHIDNIEECTPTFDSELNILSDSLVVQCGTKISSLDTISNFDTTNTQSSDQPKRICDKNLNDKQDKKCVDNNRKGTSTFSGESNICSTSNVAGTSGIQSLDQSKISCGNNGNIEEYTPNKKNMSNKVHSGLKRKVTDKQNRCLSKKLKYSQNSVETITNASEETSDDETSVDQSTISESTATKSLEKKKKNKEKFLEIVRKTVEDMLNARLGKKRKLKQKKANKTKRLKRILHNESDSTESDAISDEDYEAESVKRKRRHSANCSQTYSPGERKEFLIECLDKLKNTKLHRSCENSTIRNDDSSSEGSEVEPNDVSREFLDTVEKARMHMQALTSANDQLKSLDIKIDFDIPKLHTIAVKLTDGCSKTQRKELMRHNIKVRDGHFTIKEDFLIYTNFSRFIEAHDLEDDPIPFLNLGVTCPLPFAEKLKFAQTIGRGLNDRYLRAIHTRFQKLMSTRKTESYTPDEDEILLNFNEKLNKNKSKLAALEFILRRPKTSILKRHNELMRTTEKLRYLEPITFIKKLKHVTNVGDVNDLKNEISSEHWVALSELYENIPCSELEEYWFSSVYSRLFAKDPIDLNKILQQVTQKISEMNATRFVQVDWEKLSEPYDYITPAFLHNSFKKACHTFVPKQRQRNLQYCIKFLNRLFDKGECVMNPLDPISVP